MTPLRTKFQKSKYFQNFGQPIIGQPKLKNYIARPT